MLSSSWCLSLATEDRNEVTVAMVVGVFRARSNNELMVAASHVKARVMGLPLSKTS